MFVAPNHSLLAKNFPKPQTFIHQYLYELTRHSVPPLRTLLGYFTEAIRRSTAVISVLREGAFQYPDC
jgi:hypothetical protein